MSRAVIDSYDVPAADRTATRDGAEVLGRAQAADRVELVVVHQDGTRESATVPATAATIMRDILDKVANAARVVVMEEDAEISPEDAATILGVSRPLVRRRMEAGILPFRYVGAHRRLRLGDVLALKAREDESRRALEELAADTEDLITRHGL